MVFPSNLLVLDFLPETSPAGIQRSILTTQQSVLTMTFGSFESLCAQSTLPLCSLLGPLSALTTTPNPLLAPTCAARSIELANTIIFQAATDFAHITALGMTAIMILHVRSKFTAVGRKEILTFFYLYLALTGVSLILDAGVLEARSGGAFPWFVAVQNGLASAICTCLLVNGFVGFQLYEDGTNLSVWLLRLSSLGMFVITFAVSLLTFKSWAGLSPTNTTGLFIVLYVINAIALAIYFIMQVILVVNTLQERWPLGHLAFGVFFFVIGQVILFTFGARICEGTTHYIDGMFFATVCNLLAVMMIYKYWDSITKEDLEFSVGTKPGSWAMAQAEAKDPLLSGFGDSILEYDSRRTSAFDLGGLGTARNSMYDLNAAATPAGMASRPVDKESLLMLQQQSQQSGIEGLPPASSQGTRPMSGHDRSQSHSRSRSAGGPSANLLARYHRHQSQGHSRNQSHNQDLGRGQSRDRASGTIPGALLLEGMNEPRSQQRSRPQTRENGNSGDRELAKVAASGDRERERRERRERRRESRIQRASRFDDY